MDFEEVKKSLWHAFDVLDDATDVRKSRVRVLTNNLGQVLGVDHAETIWDKIDGDLVDFQLFVNTLQAFLLLDFDKNTNPRVSSLRAELDNLCWMLCEKVYTKRINAKEEKEKENEKEKDSDNYNNNDDSTCTNTNTKSEGEEEDGSGDKQQQQQQQQKKEGEEKKRRVFSKIDLFKLWKMFNFLCERAADGTVLAPLRIDCEEADRILCEICSTLGLSTPQTRPGSRSPRGRQTCSESFLMDYCQFVKHLANLIDANETDEVISHGIAEVHAQIISDVVRKGYMVKFGNKVTAWKDRWFVLTASALRYYASSDEKESKGTIFMCGECFTQGFPDKPGGKHHRFKLHTPVKQYELSAPDLKSKNMWMADIRRVVNHIGSHKESLQQVAWKERKEERAERRRRTAEEELRRCAEREALEEGERQLEELKKQKEQAQAEVEEREKILEEEKRMRMEEEERRKKETDELLAQKRMEIDAERQKCLETETRLKAEREELVKLNQEALDAERMERETTIEKLKREEAVLEEEKEALQERLAQLEETKEALEKAVEEERALKRDEEIVRNLQAKTLEDEFAKRAELERLRDEQKKQLMEEKLSRQELEDAHRKQEEELKLKQEQLEGLIKEREGADQKWKDASDRLKQAEQDRQHMEARLKLKEMTSSVSLAKPLHPPNPNPFVTHRGLGAFTDSDFSSLDRRQPLHVLQENDFEDGDDEHKENQAPKSPSSPLGVAEQNLSEDLAINDSA